MDKKKLVSKDMRDGKILIKHLEKTDFKINSALWLYFSEAKEWRLVLASSYFDLNGPNKSYGYIQNELENINPKIGISLTDISAVGTKDELINLISKVINTEPTEISDIRFTGNVINGTLIEDAYIYRITRNT